MCRSISVQITALSSLPGLSVHGYREWGFRPSSSHQGARGRTGYVESFNGKLRDELLDREVFDTLWEVQVLTEQWRHEYNHVRHSQRLELPTTCSRGRKAHLLSSRGYQCLITCGTTIGGRSPFHGDSYPELGGKPRDLSPAQLTTGQVSDFHENRASHSPAGAGDINPAQSTASPR